jgi:hypothetical protein
MKLDLTKPHGTVWGVHEAVYEQGGMLFGADGEPLGARAEAKALVPVNALDNAPVESSVKQAIQDFLKHHLSGGPVSKNNLYRESQTEGFVFADVKSEAADMRIGITKKAGIEMWQLPAD